MAAQLSIMFNSTGGVITKDYPYNISMSGASTSDTVLYIPYKTKLTNKDLIAAAKLDKTTATVKDLIIALTKQVTVVSSQDYAEATGQKMVDTYEQGVNAGYVEANINYVIGLTLAKNRKLLIKPTVYTINTSKLVSWKRDSPGSGASSVVKLEAVVDISLVEGTKISFMKRQRESCKDKRERVRNSLKQVFNIDIGAPKPTGVVSRRLTAPVKKSKPTRRTRSLYGWPFLPGMRYPGARNIRGFDRYGRPVFTNTRSSTPTTSSSPDSASSAATTPTNTPVRRGGNSRLTRRARRSRQTRPSNHSKRVYRRRVPRYHRTRHAH